METCLATTFILKASTAILTDVTSAILTDVTSCKLGLYFSNNFFHLLNLFQL